MFNQAKHPTPFLTTFEKNCREFLSNYVMLQDDDFVAGGFFARFLHDLPIRDIDLYTKDVEERTKFYLNLGWELVDAKHNFTSLDSREYDMTLDIIGFHDPQDISCIDTFDFTCCQVALTDDDFWVLDYYSFTTKSLALNPKFKIKETYYTKKNNILTRLKKYLDLGFYITDQELTKIYECLTTQKKETVPSDFGEQLKVFKGWT